MSKALEENKLSYLLKMLSSKKCHITSKGFFASLKFFLGT